MFFLYFFVYLRIHFCHQLSNFSKLPFSLHVPKIFHSLDYFCESLSLKFPKAKLALGITIKLNWSEFLKFYFWAFTLRVSDKFIKSLFVFRIPHIPRIDASTDTVDAIELLHAFMLHARVWENWIISDGFQFSVFVCAQS